MRFATLRYMSITFSPRPCTVLPLSLAHYAGTRRYNS